MNESVESGKRSGISVMLFLWQRVTHNRGSQSDVGPRRKELSPGIILATHHHTVWKIEEGGTEGKSPLHRVSIVGRQTEIVSPCRRQCSPRGGRLR
jgi:hypothetical protein